MRVFDHLRVEHGVDDLPFQTTYGEAARLHKGLHAVVITANAYLDTDPGPSARGQASLRLGVREALPDDGDCDVAGCLRSAEVVVLVGPADAPAEAWRPLRTLCAPCLRGEGA